MAKRAENAKFPVFSLLNRELRSEISWARLRPQPVLHGSGEQSGFNGNTSRNIATFTARKFSARPMQSQNRRIIHLNSPAPKIPVRFWLK